jgi:hypothetical protein|tara:strand:- start:2048 stop:2356 length:309 start_codon:yes stop_codon:yes gene_type:complete
MPNKECKQCKGKGWYEVLNIGYDIVESAECVDCMVEDMFKQEIEMNLAKMLSNVSKERLATIVASLIVKTVDDNPNDNLSRLENIIHTKNTLEALQIATYLR